MFKYLSQQKNWLKYRLFVVLGVKRMEADGLIGYIVSFLVGFFLGAFVWFQQGREKGFKEGVERQLHKEMYDKAPFGKSHEEPLLDEVKGRMDKKYKPKAGLAKEGLGLFDWLVLAVIVGVIGWFMLEWQG